MFADSLAAGTLDLLACSASRVDVGCMAEAALWRVCGIPCIRTLKMLSLTEFIHPLKALSLLLSMLMCGSGRC